ncbi:MAG: beta-ketoacyl-ACP synthase II [Eggerthellaceae bacterium]|jgi:3-oxoacyl-[acyl-carrier-protein] synthase II
MANNPRRVVVTGMGAVTPIGHSVAETWNAAKAGTCGIGPITQYDSADMKVSLAGEVKDLDVTAYIEKRDARKMARFTQLAMIASAEAFASSGINMEKEDPTRCGVIVSSGIGSLSDIETNHLRGMDKGFDRVSPHFIPMVITNIAAGTIAIKYGFKGVNYCVVTACAGGAHAIGEAFHLIRNGGADLMFAGGSESCVTPLAIGGFTAMTALTTTTDVKRASIPFDKERSGFVLGEGAGIFILEELEHALARGAHIYAECVGYGATCDAYHITAPDPEGDGCARSMELALEDAGIEPAAIDYINAHGTSTQLNDSCETLAIKRVFGEDTEIPVSSTKSMTGHLLGATGAVEAIFSCKTVEENYILPTINYEVADPACDLNLVVNEGRSEEVNYALSDNLGFGGHNTSLIFKKWNGSV